MKNSFTFPNYSKKVLSALDTLNPDRAHFLLFLEKQPMLTATEIKSDLLRTILAKLGLITTINVDAYPRSSLEQAYQTGHSDSRLAVQNVLLKRAKKPTFCAFHQVKIGACACLY